MDSSSFPDGGVSFGPAVAIGAGAQASGLPALVGNADAYAPDSLYGAYISLGASVPVEDNTRDNSKSAFLQGYVNYADPYSGYVSPVGSAHDLMTLDPDPFGRKTEQYGQSVGRPYTTNDVLSLNVFGRDMSAEELNKTRAGRELLGIARKNRKGAKRGFLEALTDFQWSDLPFIGMFASVGGSIKNAVDVSGTMKKLQNGEAVSDDELIKTRLYLADQEYRSSGGIGSMIGDIVRAAPGFMVEFALSSGLWSLGRAGAAKAASGSASWGARLALTRATKSAADDLAGIVARDVIKGGAKEVTEEALEAGWKKLAADATDRAMRKQVLGDISKKLYDSVARDLGGDLATKKAVEGIARRRAEIALDRQVLKHTTSGAVKRWTLGAAGFLRDHASRALLDFGRYGSIDGARKLGTAGQYLSNALGIMAVEAPIRGALIMMPQQLAAKPILGAAFGKDGRTMTSHELSLQSAALMSGNKQLMEDSKAIAAGLNFLEYASESSGPGFDSLFHAAGMKLLPAKQLNKEAGGWFRNLIHKSVGTAEEFGKGVRNNQHIAVAAALRRGGALDGLSKLDAERTVTSIIGRAVSGAADAVPVTGRAAEMVAKAGGADKFLRAAMKDAIQRQEVGVTFKHFAQYVLANKMFLNNMTPDATIDWLKVAGYDGIIQEMMEERYSDFAKGLFGWDERTKDEKGALKNMAMAFRNLWPGWEQLVAEAVGFSVPMGVRVATNHVQRAAGGSKLSFVRYWAELMSSIPANSHVEVATDAYFREIDNRLSSLDANIERLSKGGPVTEEEAGGLSREVREALAERPDGEETREARDKRIAGTREKLSVARKALAAQRKRVSDSIGGAAHEMDKTVRFFEAPNTQVEDEDTLRLHEYMTPEQASRDASEFEFVVKNAAEAGRILDDMTSRAEGEHPMFWNRVASKVAGVAGALMTGDMSLAFSNPAAWIVADNGISGGLGEQMASLSRKYDALARKNLLLATVDSDYRAKEKNLAEMKGQAEKKLAESIKKAAERQRDVEEGRAKASEELDGKEADEIGALQKSLTDIETDIQSLRDAQHLDKGRIREASTPDYTRASERFISSWLSSNGVKMFQQSEMKDIAAHQIEDELVAKDPSRVRVDWSDDAGVAEFLNTNIGTDEAPVLIRDQVDKRADRIAEITLQLVHNRKYSDAGFSPYTARRDFGNTLLNIPVDSPLYKDALLASALEMSGFADSFEEAEIDSYSNLNDIAGKNSLPEADIAQLSALHDKVSGTGNSQLTQREQALIDKAGRAWGYRAPRGTPADISRCNQEIVHTARMLQLLHNDNEIIWTRPRDNGAVGAAAVIWAPGEAKDVIVARRDGANYTWLETKSTEDGKPAVQIRKTMSESDMNDYMSKMEHPYSREVPTVAFGHARRISARDSATLIRQFGLGERFVSRYGHMGSQTAHVADPMFRFKKNEKTGMPERMYETDEEALAVRTREIHQANRYAKSGLNGSVKDESGLTRDQVRANYRRDYSGFREMADDEVDAVIDMDHEMFNIVYYTREGASGYLTDENNFLRDQGFTVPSTAECRELGGVAENPYKRVSAPYGAVPGRMSLPGSANTYIFLDYRHNPNLSVGSAIADHLVKNGVWKHRSLIMGVHGDPTSTGIGRIVSSFYRRAEELCIRLATESYDSHHEQEGKDMAVLRRQLFDGNGGGIRTSTLVRLITNICLGQVERDLHDGKVGERRSASWVRLAKEMRHDAATYLPMFAFTDYMLGGSGVLDAVRAETETKRGKKPPAVERTGIVRVIDMLSKPSETSNFLFQELSPRSGGNQRMETKEFFKRLSEAMAEAMKGKVPSTSVTRGELPESVEDLVELTRNFVRDYHGDEAPKSFPEAITVFGNDLQAMVDKLGLGKIGDKQPRTLQEQIERLNLMEAHSTQTNEELQAQYADLKKKIADKTADIKLAEARERSSEKGGDSNVEKLNKELRELRDELSVVKTLMDNRGVKPVSETPVAPAKTPVAPAKTPVAPAETPVAPVKPVVHEAALDVEEEDDMLFTEEEKKNALTPGKTDPVPVDESPIALPDSAEIDAVNLAYDENNDEVGAAARAVLALAFARSASSTVNASDPEMLMQVAKDFLPMHTDADIANICKRCSELLNEHGFGTSGIADKSDAFFGTDFTSKSDPDMFSALQEFFDGKNANEGVDTADGERFGVKSATVFQALSPFERVLACAAPAVGKNLQGFLTIARARIADVVAAQGERTRGLEKLLSSGEIDADTMARQETREHYLRLAAALIDQRLARDLDVTGESRPDVQLGALHMAIVDKYCGDSELAHEAMEGIIAALSGNGDARDAASTQLAVFFSYILSLPAAPRKAMFMLVSSMTEAGVAKTAFTEKTRAENQRPSDVDEEGRNAMPVNQRTDEDEVLGFNIVPVNAAPIRSVPDVLGSAFISFARNHTGASAFSFEGFEKALDSALSGLGLEGLDNAVMKMSDSGKTTADTRDAMFRALQTFRGNCISIAQALADVLGEENSISCVLRSDHLYTYYRNLINYAKDNKVKELSFVFKAFSPWTETKDGRETTHRPNFVEDLLALARRLEKEGGQLSETRIASLCRETFVNGNLEQGSAQFQESTSHRTAAITTLLNDFTSSLPRTSVLADLGDGSASKNADRPQVAVSLRGPIPIVSRWMAEDPEGANPFSFRTLARLNLCKELVKDYNRLHANGKGTFRAKYQYVRDQIEAMYGVAFDVSEERLAELEKNAAAGDVLYEIPKEVLDKIILESQRTMTWPGPRHLPVVVRNITTEYGSDKIVAACKNQFVERSTRENRWFIPLYAGDHSSNNLIQVPGSIRATGSLLDAIKANPRAAEGLERNDDSKPTAASYFVAARLINNATGVSLMGADSKRSAISSADAEQVMMAGCDIELTRDENGRVTHTTPVFGENRIAIAMTLGVDPDSGEPYSNKALLGTVLTAGFGAEMFRRMSKDPLARTEKLHFISTGDRISFIKALSTLIGSGASKEGGAFPEGSAEWVLAKHMLEDFYADDGAFNRNSLTLTDFDSYKVGPAMTKKSQGIYHGDGEKLISVVEEIKRRLDELYADKLAYDKAPEAREGASPEEKQALADRKANADLWSKIESGGISGAEIDELVGDFVWRDNLSGERRGVDPAANKPGDSPGQTVSSILGDGVMIKFVKGASTPTVTISYADNSMVAIRAANIAHPSAGETKHNNKNYTTDALTKAIGQTLESLDSGYDTSVQTGLMDLLTSYSAISGAMATSVLSVDAILRNSKLLERENRLVQLGGDIARTSQLYRDRAAPIEAAALRKSLLSPLYKTDAALVSSGAEFVTDKDGKLVRDENGRVKIADHTVSEMRRQCHRGSYVFTGEEKEFFAGNLGGAVHDTARRLALCEVNVQDPFFRYGWFLDEQALDEVFSDDEDDPMKSRAGSSGADRDRGIVLRLEKLFTDLRDAETEKRRDDVTALRGKIAKCFMDHHGLSIADKTVTLPDGSTGRYIDHVLFEDLFVQDGKGGRVFDRSAVGADSELRVQLDTYDSKGELTPESKGRKLIFLGGSTFGVPRTPSYNGSMWLQTARASFPVTETRETDNEGNLTSWSAGHDAMVALDPQTLYILGCDNDGDEAAIYFYNESRDAFNAGQADFADRLYEELAGMRFEGDGEGELPGDPRYRLDTEEGKQRLMAALIEKTVDGDAAPARDDKSAEAKRLRSRTWIRKTKTKGFVFRDAARQAISNSLVRGLFDMSRQISVPRREGDGPDIHEFIGSYDEKQGKFNGSETGPTKAQPFDQANIWDQLRSNECPPDILSEDDATIGDSKTQWQVQQSAQDAAAARASIVRMAEHLHVAFLSGMFANFTVKTVPHADGTVTVLRNPYALFPNAKVSTRQWVDFMRHFDGMSNMTFDDIKERICSRIGLNQNMIDVLVADFLSGQSIPTTDEEFEQIMTAYVRSARYMRGGKYVFDKEKGDSRDTETVLSGIKLSLSDDISHLFMIKASNDHYTDETFRKLLDKALFDGAYGYEGRRESVESLVGLYVDKDGKQLCYKDTAREKGTARRVIADTLADEFRKQGGYAHMSSVAASFFNQMTAPGDKNGFSVSEGYLFWLLSAASGSVGELTAKHSGLDRQVTEAEAEEIKAAVSRMVKFLHTSKVLKELDDFAAAVQFVQVNTGDLDAAGKYRKATEAFNRIAEATGLYDAANGNIPEISRKLVKDMRRAVVVAHSGQAGVVNNGTSGNRGRRAWVALNRWAQEKGSGSAAENLGPVNQGIVVFLAGLDDHDSRYAVGVRNLVRDIVRICDDNAENLRAGDIRSVVSGARHGTYVIAGSQIIPRVGGTYIKSTSDVYRFSECVARGVRSSLSEMLESPHPLSEFHDNVLAFRRGIEAMFEFFYALSSTSTAGIKYNGLTSLYSVPDSKYLGPRHNSAKYGLPQRQLLVPVDGGLAENKMNADNSLRTIRPLYSVGTPKAYGEMQDAFLALMNGSLSNAKYESRYKGGGNKTRRLAAENVLKGFKINNATLDAFTQLTLISGNQHIVDPAVLSSVKVLRGVLKQIASWKGLKNADDAVITMADFTRQYLPWYAIVMHEINGIPSFDSFNGSLIACFPGLTEQLAKQQVLNDQAFDELAGDVHLNEKTKDADLVNFADLYSQINTAPVLIKRSIENTRKRIARMTKKSVDEVSEKEAKRRVLAVLADGRADEGVVIKRENPANRQIVDIFKDGLAEKIATFFDLSRKNALYNGGDTLTDAQIEREQLMQKSWGETAMATLRTMKRHNDTPVNRAARSTGVKYANSPEYAEHVVNDMFPAIVRRWSPGDRPSAGPSLDLTGEAPVATVGGKVDTKTIDGCIKWMHTFQPDWVSINREKWIRAGLSKEVANDDRYTLFRFVQEFGTALDNRTGPEADAGSETIIDPGADVPPAKFTPPEAVGMSDPFGKRNTEFPITETPTVTKEEADATVSDPELTSLHDQYDFIIALDTETTGANPAENRHAEPNPMTGRIIELAANKYTWDENGKLVLVGRYVTRVALDLDRSVKNSSIHHITSDDVWLRDGKERPAADGKPSVKTRATVFREFCGMLGEGDRTLLIAHKAPFDASMLTAFVDREFMALGDEGKALANAFRRCDWLDTLTVSNDRLPSVARDINSSEPQPITGSHTLSRLYKVYDKRYGESKGAAAKAYAEGGTMHSANADVDALMAVTKYLSQERGDLGQYVNQAGYNPYFGMSHVSADTTFVHGPQNIYMTESGKGALPVSKTFYNGRSDDSLFALQDETTPVADVKFERDPAKTETPEIDTIKFAHSLELTLKSFEAEGADTKVEVRGNAVYIYRNVVGGEFLKKSGRSRIRTVVRMDLSNWTGNMTDKGGVPVFLDLNSLSVLQSLVAHIRRSPNHGGAFSRISAEALRAAPYSFRLELARRFAPTSLYCGAAGRTIHCPVWSVDSNGIKTLMSGVSLNTAKGDAGELLKAAYHEYFHASMSMMLSMGVLTRADCEKLGKLVGASETGRNPDDPRTWYNEEKLAYEFGDFAYNANKEAAALEESGVLELKDHKLAVHDKSGGVFSKMLNFLRELFSTLIGVKVGNNFSYSDQFAETDDGPVGTKDLLFGFVLSGAMIQSEDGTGEKELSVLDTGIEVTKDASLDDELRARFADPKDKLARIRQTHEESLAEDSEQVRDIAAKFADPETTDDFIVDTIIDYAGRAGEFSRGNVYDDDWYDSAVTTGQQLSEIGETGKVYAKTLGDATFGKHFIESADMANTAKALTQAIMNQYDSIPEDVRRRIEASPDMDGMSAEARDVALRAANEVAEMYGAKLNAAALRDGTEPLPRLARKALRLMYDMAVRRDAAVFPNRGPVHGKDKAGDLININQRRHVSDAVLAAGILFNSGVDSKDIADQTVDQLRAGRQQAVAAGQHKVAQAIDYLLDQFLALANNSKGADFAFRNIKAGFVQTGMSEDGRREYRQVRLGLAEDESRAAKNIALYPIDDPLFLDMFETALRGGYVLVSSYHYAKMAGVPILAHNGKHIEDDIRDVITQRGFIDPETGEFKNPAKAEPLTIGETAGLLGMSMKDLAESSQWDMDPYVSTSFMLADPSGWLMSTLRPRFHGMDLREISRSEHNAAAGILTRFRRLQNYWTRYLGLDVADGSNLLKLHQTVADTEFVNGHAVRHEYTDEEKKHHVRNYFGAIAPRWFGLDRALDNVETGIVMTREDHEVVDWMLKAIDGYVQGQRYMYTSIGDLTFGRKDVMDAEDNARVYTAEYFSPENVRNRMLSDKTGRNVLSDLDMSLYRLIGASEDSAQIPSAILYSDNGGYGFYDKLVDAVVQALNTVGQGYAAFYKQEKAEKEAAAERGIAPRFLGKFDISAQILGLLEHSGVVACHRKMETIGTIYGSRRASVPVNGAIVLNINEMEDFWKTTDTYRKLVEGNREASELTFENIGSKAMGAFHEIMDFARKNRWITEGDGSLINGLGSHLPFYAGSGSYKWQCERIRKDEGKSETDKLEGYEKSLYEDLNREDKEGQNKGATVNQWRLLGAAFGLVKSDGRFNTSDELAKAVLRGEFAPGEPASAKTGLVMTPEDARDHRKTAVVIYQRLHDLAFSRRESEINMVRALGGRRSVATMINLYDTEASRRGAATGCGLNADQMFRSHGVLPANMQVFHHVDDVIGSVARTLQFRNTLVGMVTAQDVNGRPLAYVQPSTTGEPTETDGIPESLWSELARWWVAANPELGLKYDENMSGRANAFVLYDVIMKSTGGTIGGRHFGQLSQDYLDGVQSVSSFAAVDDTNDSDHSSVRNQLNGGEALGYAKHLFSIPRVVGGRFQTALLRRITSWSKTMSVQCSLFFPIATRFESVTGAVGFWTMLLSNTDPKKAKYFEGAMKQFDSVFGTTIGDQMNRNFIGMKDIMAMMDSDDPFLDDCYEICAALGLQLSDRLINPAEGDKSFVQKDVNNICRIMRHRFGRAAEARARNVLDGFLFRGSERSLTYVLNATKIATALQIAQSLEAKARREGRSFNIIRDLKPYSDYIAAEIGGIDPLQYAWANKRFRDAMSFAMFSWEWSKGAWTAGGGEILEDALFGGHMTNPKMREHMIGRWLRMFGTIMIGVPALGQIVCKLLGKCMGWDDDDDKWFSWQNEEKIGLSAMDITPVLKGLNSFELIRDAKKIPIIGSLIPAYTGGDKYNSTSARRYYLHFGKQGWEFFRWFTHPWEQGISKLSMPVQHMIENIAGFNPSNTQYELPMSDMSLLERWMNPTVDGAVFNFMKSFIPFSANTLMTYGDAGLVSVVGPVKMGSSKRKMVKDAKLLLQAWAEDEGDGGYSQGMPRRYAGKRRNIPRLASILEDARRNGIDPADVLKNAAGQAQTKYTRILYAELPKTLGDSYDEKKIRKAARALNRLGTPLENVVQALKKQSEDRNVVWQDRRQLERFYGTALRAMRNPYADTSRGLDVRQAAGSGPALANFLATDEVPETVFGIPVVSRREDYTEGDLAFFRDNPRAAGYYRLDEEE